ncbi:hypothetical protein MLD38_005558 [Melastoma candidum]|uniref:Uncharacterized protein n=1 Tax=Melastoma candidum TaxID=119954 RepID=A0ACB9RNP7_9MYRT|nr:hypothetical protein MLD38_005558 [Melastoma candidum]
MLMEEAMEGGNLGPYKEKLRTFPNMSSKPQTLLIVRLLMGINFRVLLMLVLLVLGGIFHIGTRTSPVIVLVFTIVIFSFLLSTFLTKWVLSKDEGPPEMAEISEAIRDGAEGFFRLNMVLSLRWQYY